MIKTGMKKVFATALAMVLTFNLTACGNSGGENNLINEREGSGGAEDYAWVVSYWHLPMNKNSDIGSVSFVGTNMYYTHYTYREVTTGEFRSLDLLNLDMQPALLYKMGEAEYNSEAEFVTFTSNIAPDGNSGVLIVEQTQPVITDYADPGIWEWQKQQTAYSLQKIGAGGNEIFSVDITEYLQMDMENNYLQYMITNEEGRIFLSNGATWLWIFEADGTHVTDIRLSEDDKGLVCCIGFLSDGRLALIQNANNGNTEIKIYNEEKQDFSDVYENLPPNVHISGMSVGPDGSILLEGEDILYSYDPETRTYTELLRWLDCDMNPDYVNGVNMLDEETIAAYYRDRNTNEASVAILKKTPASEVGQKQTLVLGCMTVNPNLQSAVADFNQNNNEYRIEMRDYAASVDFTADPSDVQEAYDSAQTKLINDILTGNAPDLFVANGINIKLFAEKGVIEDLNPYLESSSVVGRDDLITPVLDAYTNSGILCTIPTTFYVQTLLGRTSEVGEQGGWTVGELIAYSEQYPDAVLYSGADRRGVLVSCLIYDFDSYVSWETGECSFDSDDFKRVLELANRYPEEGDHLRSEPGMISTHDALLYRLVLNNFQEWQLAELMFGEEATPIGYPSANGTGVVVNSTGGLCISATSDHKEACWAFIESMLTKEAFEALGNSMFFIGGFPILQSVFDSQLEEAMMPDYVLDENGEPMADENGEPMERPKDSYNWGDVTFNIYSVSEEDAAAIREIINRINGTNDYDVQIMNIIEEESGAYFTGQKSVDEVADIIQRRVGMYVNESR